MNREEKVQELKQEPEIMLAAAEARIAWVLEHPHMSDWLKQALRTADGRDPTALHNDVEMLKHLIMARSQALIEIAMSPVRVP